MWAVWPAAVHAVRPEASPKGRAASESAVTADSGGRRTPGQPLSVGALLETIATWTELLTYVSLLGRMTDVDEQAVAAAVYSRQAAATLYNPSLTEYTAPVHLLSAKAGTKEAMLSYHTGAAIASICMNLTEELSRSSDSRYIFDIWARAARRFSWRAGSRLCVCLYCLQCARVFRGRSRRRLVGHSSR
jgi:hypothetical protein